MPANWSMDRIRESEEKRKERNRRKAAKQSAKTQTYTIRVYHGSEFEQAIEKAAADAGKQPGRYVRIAVIEKLTRDGYMPENAEEEVEE